MSDAHGGADCSQEGEAEGIVDDSLETSVPVKQEVCSDEGASGSQCKSGFEESAQVNGTTEVDDDKEVSLLEMVETFSADIEAFREAADELETMSESVQCLMRNAVNGDVRLSSV